MVDALEAIMTRRSIGKVSERRPPAAHIARLLEAAVRAPTHHLTEPWRFVVLAGEALDEMGEVMADRMRRDSPDDPLLARKMEAERMRPRRAPVIVTMVYVPSDHPKAVEMEDRYAVGAAMQNMLLAAHALGLGAYLRTGPAATDPGVAAFLGLAPGEEVAGFVYVGYPELEEPPPPTPRRPAAERAIWRGWEERG